MAMSQKTGVIWLDGELISWQDAKVHVLTHTLHYGMGCFEGVRAYETDKGPAIFRLQEHTDRLFRSAHILGMPFNFDKETVNNAQCEVVKKNNLKSAYIRPMLFYGSEGMGLRADNLKTHLMVAAWEWGHYMGEENINNGIRIHTSSHTRHHVNVTMCKAKANANYLNSMLAVQEAINNGYDEALLLDTEGYVSEGSGENIFIVRNGELHTPETSTCLEGITRDTIMQFAKKLNIPVKEKRITRDEVYIADEAFFTGTAAEVTPIRELDGRTIGNGGRGPLTEKLQKLYFDHVKGKQALFNGWLTHID